jgi:tetrahydromethanopterin S-methyltransferase subunit F
MPADLLELARWQAGLVTRGQALRAGLTSNAITSKVVHA